MWVILRLQYVKLSHFSIFIIWCKCFYQKPKASFIILFYFLNPRQPQGLAFFSQLLHTQWIGLMANVAFLILLNEVFFHYQKKKKKKILLLIIVMWWGVHESTLETYFLFNKKYIFFLIKYILKKEFKLLILALLEVHHLSQLIEK